MPLPPSALSSFEAQQRITATTVAGARRAWAGMGADFTASWRTVGPRLVLLVTSAQLASARNAVNSMPLVLADLDLGSDSAGDVDPSAFAGTASDGRTLDGLLYSGVTTAKQAVGAGASSDEALDRGRKAIDGLVQTMAMDAAREALAASIAVNRSVPGYVRQLRPPSCPRCAVLAGKWFKWNRGFQRHKNCDCVHIPARENMLGDLTTDPLLAIKSGQVTGLSKAEATAILDNGADVGQVINAQRGMATASIGGRNVGITLEGTTKHGYANQVRREIASRRATLTPYQSFAGNRAPRLTVEEIFTISEDREDVIRLLTVNGYVRPTGDQRIADVARRVA